MALAEATGLTPLEIMLQGMRRSWTDAEAFERLKAEADNLPVGDRVKLTEAAIDARKAACDIAKDAAPYVHAKLAVTETKITGDVTTRDATPVDRPPRETREEWIARRRRELFALVPAAGSAN